jgi:hypothetical protein
MCFPETAQALVGALLPISLHLFLETKGRLGPRVHVGGHG